MGDAEASVRDARPVDLEGSVHRDVEGPGGSGETEADGLRLDLAVEAHLSHPAEAGAEASGVEREARGFVVEIPLSFEDPHAVDPEFEPRVPTRRGLGQGEIRAVFPEAQRDPGALDQNVAEVDASSAETPEVPLDRGPGNLDEGGAVGLGIVDDQLVNLDAEGK